ncbi:uncharacterized protein DEA37_0001466 [Paragonimus westermani]|uniref:Uncharacterized protein n=1 Tax=Paragonimus westermani TaxID=34504 RepID=A0A5J4P1D3_9TREM|nr:uncharacterized protein DEA37_0001466 [Paragonimus westermani]
MGIQISKPVKKLKTHITLDRTDHEVPCRVRPIKSAESQRNGNATKLIEHDRAILFSPIPISSACSLFSTISSHRPRVGTSPAEQTKHRSTADTTSNEDECQLKQNYNPQLYNSHLEVQNDTRLPWKPCSVISNRYERRVMHTNGSTKCRCVFTELPYGTESRISRKPKNLDRKSASFSLPVLCDGRFQLGEAHLRRCTAAQQVQANKPDILDSLGVHNCNKTNLSTTLASDPGKLYTLKKKCTTTTSGNCNSKCISVLHETLFSMSTPIWDCFHSISYFIIHAYYFAISRNISLDNHHRRLFVS